MVASSMDYVNQVFWEKDAQIKHLRNTVAKNLKVGIVNQPQGCAIWGIFNNNNGLQIEASGKIKMALKVLENRTIQICFEQTK